MTTRTITLSRRNFTLMARALASHLKEHGGYDVKHSHARSALSRLLGFNEHSIAAALKDAPLELTIEDDAARCAAPGCTRSVAVLRFCETHA